MAATVQKVSQHQLAWQLLLVITGILLIVVSALLGVEASSMTVTTVTTKSGATTSTDVHGARPSDTLVTAVLVAGAALVIAGALINRITKVVLPGGVEIDAATLASVSAAAANVAPGNAARTAKIAKQAALRLTTAGTDPTDDEITAAVSAAARAIPG